jgi:hypothetical protein
MTFYDYLEWLAGQIVNNTALKTACTTYFGRAPVAFVGVDDQVLPEAEDCPMVILTAGGRQISAGSFRIARPARLCLAIADDVQPDTSTSVVAFRGPTRLDELMKLVAQAVLKSREPTAAFAVEAVTPGLDDELRPPIFKAWIGIDISYVSDITIT